MSQGFLPICKKDMEERGWEQLDFVYISGDAYVDHPSFGPAVITRLLEDYGYKVGIIAQPDWKDKNSITVLGEPRLAFLVSAGNMDSMVNHYSVSKRRRSTDAYTPGGVMGKRPDYAVTVYGNLIRQVYKKTPIILGGIEASLRRLAHYDYWSNKLKRSVLLDSGADIISYGMGEHSIIEIAEALDSGLSIQDITYIPGTVCKVKSLDSVYEPTILPSYEQLKEDKLNYARSFYVQYCNTDPFSGKCLVEPYSDHLYVVQNPPAKPLSQDEMDLVYGLPYMRTYHPSYEKDGGVPAIKEIKFSLISNRGCFGGCSFCALTFHQGRIIQARSHESLVDEAKLLTEEPDFKGYIHDVGGPTANFRGPACKKQLTLGACKNKQCLFPEPCKNMDISHKKYLNLLRKLRAIKGVKKVFIRSGIRFDYLINDKDDTFFYELCKYHVSGQLKVAPEHISDNVLKYMGKPENSVFNKFSDKFYQINEKIGKKQYLVPYLMSSHPGSTIRDAVRLAEYLHEHNINPQQVQDFYPTPGTISTCMFYTGIDPFTMKKVYVPKTPHEKSVQRALLQYRNPENYKLVYEALTKIGRTDLIGYQNRCLIRPPKGDILSNNQKKNRRNDNGKAINGKGSFGKNKGRTQDRSRKSEKRESLFAVIIV